MSSIVSPTSRLMALVILASSLIALDLFMVASTGLLGLAIIVFILILRVYVVLAQTVLANIRVITSYDGIREGDPLKVAYTMCNETVVPIAIVELSLAYPEYLKIIEGSPGALILIPPRGCITYKTVFLARVGKHRIGPLRAVLRDPFGFFKGAELKLGDILEVSIRPREGEVLRKILLNIARSTGLSKARRAGEGSEFYFTRDYRPGDDLKRIYWKALAKMRLAVREYERESMIYTLFLLLIDKSMLYGPYLNTPLEHISRIIAIVSRHLAEKNDWINSIILAGGRLQIGIPGRGRRGYVNIINNISSIDYMSIMSDRSDSENLKALLRSTISTIVSTTPRSPINLIVIASLDNATSVASELKHLQYLGKFTIHMFIPIPHLYGLEKISPFERAIYRIKTFSDTSRAQSIVRDIRRTGIRALAVTPWDMATRIIARIERMRV
ncbi:MAG: DUF58 domain-containing protein [Acidilobaceae archaeon]